MGSELYGVAEQVNKDLLEPILIRAESQVWDARSRFNPQLDILFIRLETQELQ